MGIVLRSFEIPKKLECDEESLTDNYGKFVAEPFERGYGVTIGNSLRRVLLSSLEGAAVTSIRSKGSLMNSRRFRESPKTSRKSF